MQIQHKDVIDKAMGDPAHIYGVPANVLTDIRLNDDEKRTILENWALDQRRLMESEDENMTQVTGGRPSAAALYQDILKACRKLGHHA
jgi:hypothetical protein